MLEILDWPFLRPHGRHNYSDYAVLCDTIRGSFIRMVVIRSCAEGEFLAKLNVGMVICALARIFATVCRLEEWRTQSMQGDRYHYLECKPDMTTW